HPRSARPTPASPRKGAAGLPCLPYHTASWRVHALARDVHPQRRAEPPGRARQCCFKGNGSASVWVDGAGIALVGCAGRAAGRPSGADVFAAWLLLLPGDVLAPPAYALAHAEGGGGVHVGRGDALALLVGALPARARWDLVDSVEDLIHMVVEAFLGLGLAALVRWHQTLRLLLPARMR